MAERPITGVQSEEVAQCRPLVASVAPERPPERVAEPSSWPDRPAREALYGLAGDVVTILEPHTESDPAAILVQLLVAFGNVVGRLPYFQVEGDAHHTNLFAVLVGPSSKARKGTSWGQVRRLITNALEDMERASYSDTIQSGLSSGEGLIWAVRDPTSDEDPGIVDKRRLVVETEFARPLVAMGREGNVLSELLRQSWDTGDLQIMTKNNPAKATAAHISFVGHITRDDLRRHLGTTEQANGFANRFLWACVRRSKTLPEGGSLSDEMLAPLLQRLRAAITFGGNVREISRDNGARELWREVYPALSDGRPGLLGAVVSRAEAQVLRLSMIYALLDLSQMIRIDHLRAALAMWKYCEASARHIFGDSLGSHASDTILSSLRARGAVGLTRTEIRDLFGRHQSEGQISAALASLHELGLANHRREESGGRPAERWFAARESAT